MLFDLPHLQNRRSPLGPIKSPVTLLVGPPLPYWKGSGLELGGLPVPAPEFCLPSPAAF